MIPNTPNRYTEMPKGQVVLDSNDAKLDTTDKLLPVLIALAMALGLAVGKVGGNAIAKINSLQVTNGVSLIIFLGLLLMLYPPLAKIKFYEFKPTAMNIKAISVSILFNWIIGPTLMFALAWVFLANSPSLRTGLILVGIARCIAMVVLWSDMAKGDSELTGMLVVLNSIFQLVAFSLLAYFYLWTLPHFLDLSGSLINIKFSLIAVNILIYLGTPLILAVVIRIIYEKIYDRKRYETHFCPKIGHVATAGLLFTVFMLFSISGKYFLKQPLLILNVALALVIYFVVMFSVAFFTAYKLNFGYKKTVSLAFTASGNNFELAIAVAIGVFGIASNQALAGITGPMVEIPVLVGLTYFARSLKPKFKN